MNATPEQMRTARRAAQEIADVLHLRWGAVHFMVVEGQVRDLDITYKTREADYDSEHERRT